uniref:Uncharacterized protein n=1 Tax=Siphoviridae sp. ctkkB9 TaxID=2825644 RepID=A0A8S5TZI8_9CAUD|nr:MAG TPA: hypothetical protein [Siphoviridae sp. ctkkB9]
MCHISSLLSRFRSIGRFIYFLIPVFDNFRSYGSITFRDLCLPRMLALAVHFVAAKNRTLNSRCRESNTVTLGSKVCGRNTELHTIEPVILVFAVGFLCTETHSYRLTAILTCRHHNAVCINGRTRKVGCHRSTDIIHTKRKCAVLKFLYDFRCTIIGIKGCLGKFHRKVGVHCLCQLHRSTVGFISRFIFGDFGIKKFIKTDSSHCLFLHFIVFCHIHVVMEVACFGFITDISAVGYGKIRANQGTDNQIFIFCVAAFGIQRNSSLLDIASWSIVSMKFKAVCHRHYYDIFLRSIIFEHTRFKRDTQRL